MFVQRCWQIPLKCSSIQGFFRPLLTYCLSSSKLRSARSPDLLALVNVHALPVLGLEPRLADAPVGPGAVLSGVEDEFD